MLRLVVVDHSFVEESYRKRWKLLAKEHPVDVTLLTPRKWWLDAAGAIEEVCASPENKGNYRLIPLPTTSKQDWMKYLFLSPDAKLRSLDPDLIHVQHSEMTHINHQMILYRRLWAPDARITFFSMNARGVPQRRWDQRIRWNHLKDNASAALCHYPGCRESLREGGFDDPIYIQTSYGVDEETFYPDDETREQVREDLGLEGRFVIGYAGRLTPDKGLDDLVEALPLDGIDWSLLLVGDGELRDEIARRVRAEGWEERVEITGYVRKGEVARYMVAMDCFVLGSKTREYWIDTFPRSIVEAMACEVPVIGSDSGAIPFQVQDAGLIYPEGHVGGLRERLFELARNKALRERLAKKGREESVSRFGQHALSDNFYKIIRQVYTGQTEFNESNESLQYKAY